MRDNPKWQRARLRPGVAFIATSALPEPFWVQLYLIRALGQIVAVTNCFDRATGRSVVISWENLELVEPEDQRDTLTVEEFGFVQRWDEAVAV